MKVTATEVGMETTADFRRFFSQPSPHELAVSQRISSNTPPALIEELQHHLDAHLGTWRIPCECRACEEKKDAVFNVVAPRSSCSLFSSPNSVQNYPTQWYVPVSSPCNAELLDDFVVSSRISGFLLSSSTPVEVEYNRFSYHLQDPAFQQPCEVPSPPLLPLRTGTPQNKVDKPSFASFLKRVRTPAVRRSRTSTKTNATDPCSRGPYEHTILAMSKRRTDPENPASDLLEAQYASPSPISPISPCDAEISCTSSLSVTAPSPTQPHFRSPSPSYRYSYSSNPVLKGCQRPSRSPPNHFDHNISCIPVATKSLTTHSSSFPPTNKLAIHTFLYSLSSSKAKSREAVKQPRRYQPAIPFETLLEKFEAAIPKPRRSSRLSVV